MATYSNSAREVEMPNGDVVVLHSAPTGGANTTSNIKKFKYDDNGHVTESDAADAEDLNLSSYSTPTTGTTAIGTSDDIQTAIGKLDHQSHIDQTNILLLEQMNGAKNHIDSKIESQTITTGGANITVTVNPDKSFEISGTTGSSDIFITICKKTDFVLPAGDYVFSGLLSGAESGLYLYMAQGSSYVHVTNGSYPTAEFSINSNQAYTVAIHLEPNKSFSTPQKIYPMISDKSAWDSGLTQYMPYALPNYDLTRLEAEDRASLAEVVDSGAKNLVPMTWTNTDPFTDIHMTKNSDGSISVTATNTAATRIIELATNLNNYLTVGKNYVLSGCDGGDYNNHYGFALSTSNYTGRVFEANGSEEFTYASEVVNFTLVVRAGESWTKTFKPMVATKAAFGVSNKFVPYRPNWDLVQYMLPKSKTVSFNVTEANTYQIVSDLSIALPTGYTAQVSVTAWRETSTPYTPASGIRIFTDSTGTSVLNESTVAVNESPVTQQLGLSTTTVVKNIGGNSLPVYVAVRYPAAVSIRVTIFYTIVPGSRDT